VRPAGTRRSRSLAVAIVTAGLVLAGVLTGAAPASADDLPFTTTPLPTLGQTPVAGEETWALTGAWSPTPTSFTFQWFEDGAPVANAVRSVFYPALADQGKQLTVAVTAIKAGYAATTETSDPTEILGEIDEVQATVTGLAKPGDTVTAHGSFTPADVDLSYHWYDGAALIPGATDSTYVPTEEEVGDLLYVDITASKTGYRSTDVTTYMRVAGDTIQTQPEYVSGSATVGMTLTASGNYWYPTPTTVRYQWMRDGVDIDGATSSTYIATTADVGHVLTFRMTGSHAEYPDAVVVSNPSQPVLKAFDSISTPTISGIPQAGVPVTPSLVPWVPAPTYSGFDWYVNGNYKGSGATFTPTGGEVGGTLTVTAYGSSATRGLTVSPQSAPSQPIVANPYALGPVTIGSVHLNRTVTVKFATPPAGITIGYQWKIDSAPILGATDSTYTPEGSDWGHHLSVSVTTSGSGYATSTVSSNSERIGDGTLALGGAAIEGDEEARVGVTLHAQAQGWLPGATVHFVWRDTERGLDLSHSSSYKVPGTEKGHKLSIFAWGEAPHLGNTKKQGMIGESYLVGAGLFTTTPTPTITGTAKVGSKLTAGHGSWSPSTGLSYTYQWYAQASPTATPVVIAHATHSTLTLTSSDVGETITVRVTAHKHDYTTTGMTSLPTGAVTD
jgi:hypothetical protein